MSKLHKRNKAIIQVDCDRDWQDINISVSILTKLLTIFESNKIHATWFVVGNDLDFLDYKHFFSSLIKKNHEIGNHTYSHKKKFHLLDNEEKKFEVLQCDKRIRELGYSPIGFRAPYFATDKSSHLLLKELGYRYDSSLFPSPYLKFFNLIKKFLNKDYKTKSCSYHRDNSVNYSDVLEEIPVSVFPILRFPIHASYAMVLPERLAYKYTELIINYFRNSRAPLVYVFHLNDLCPSQYFNSREFKCFMPYEKRIDFIKWVCYRLQENFDIILTCDYAKN